MASQTSDQWTFHIHLLASQPGQVPIKQVKAQIVTANSTKWEKRPFEVIKGLRGAQRVFLMSANVCKSLRGTFSTAKSLNTRSLCVREFWDILLHV